MNALTRDLIKLTKMTETESEMAERARKDRFRQSFHLMPPVGWLNDPNGLCQLDGIYHAFFQYSPFDAEGGVKLWGHSTSENLLDWTYQGAALYPDQPFDCHGVYSGSAFIEDGKMYLYYTGNVKLEDGDYDYIYNGREGNTVLVTSADGMHFGSKKEILRNADYPSDLSCHVRDPKVWKEGGRYYMLQGARTKEDVGQALLFVSEDKEHWSFLRRLASEEPFGYMWECPDYMTVDGVKLLSASVQGLSGGVWDERNVYQSGYFLLDGDILGDYSLSEYHLWDYGFDYYAPQSFVAEDGRTIHISWMGMPDCEAYGNPTVENGWQHCFTVPREIFVKDGIVRQRPVRELKSKRRDEERATGHFKKEETSCCEAVISDIKDNAFAVTIGEELILDYASGHFEMRFVSEDKTSASAGRGIRRVPVESVEDIRILTDCSSVEVFVNDGAYVFTTRYYPKKYALDIWADGADIRFASLHI